MSKDDTKYDGMNRVETDKEMMKRIKEGNPNWYERNLIKIVKIFENEYNDIICRPEFRMNAIKFNIYNNYKSTTTENEKFERFLRIVVYELKMIRVKPNQNKPIRYISEFKEV